MLDRLHQELNDAGEVLYSNMEMAREDHDLGVLYLDLGAIIKEVDDEVADLHCEYIYLNDALIAMG